MPLSGPAIATVAILTFLSMWNQYLWPLMSVQSEELRPFMVGIDYFKQLNVAWGQIMAYATKGERMEQQHQRIDATAADVRTAAATWASAAAAATAAALAERIGDFLGRLPALVKMLPLIGRRKCRRFIDPIRGATP